MQRREFSLPYDCASLTSWPNQADTSGQLPASLESWDQSHGSGEKEVGDRVSARTKQRIVHHHLSNLPFSEELRPAPNFSNLVMNHQRNGQHCDQPWPLRDSFFISGTSSYSYRHDVDGQAVDRTMGQCPAYEPGGESAPARLVGLRPVPLAVFWDIENCSLPADVPADVVSSSIRNSLATCPETAHCHVKGFFAFGDFNLLPKRIREGCQRTGITLVDVPSGRKDAADKAIMADMFLFALDNPLPSVLLLISGDVDFSCVLHKLSLRGFTMLLAVPTNVGVSRCLTSGAVRAWDWLSLARGHGLVPADAVNNSCPLFPPRLLSHPSASVVPPLSQPSSGLGVKEMTGRRLAHDSPANNAREAGEGKGGQGRQGSEVCVSGTDVLVSAAFSSDSTTDGCEGSSDPQTSRNRLGPVMPLSNDAANTRDTQGVSSGSRGSDISTLRSRFIHLLQQNGGSLPLVRVPTEYRRIFGVPLFVSDFGVTKIAHLVARMDGLVQISGTGTRKLMVLPSSLRHRRRFAGARPERHVLETPVFALYRGDSSCNAASKLTPFAPQGIVKLNMEVDEACLEVSRRTGQERIGIDAQRHRLPVNLEVELNLASEVHAGMNSGSGAFEVSEAPWFGDGALAQKGLSGTSDGATAPSGSISQEPVLLEEEEILWTGSMDLYQSKAERWCIDRNVSRAIPVGGSEGNVTRDDLLAFECHREEGDPDGEEEIILWGRC